MSIDEEIIILKYNPFMRLIVLLFFFLGVFVGTMFLIAEGTNLFLQVLGGGILIYSLVMFFDILAFIEMKINNKEIKKRWLLGTYILKVQDAKVIKASYKLNRGYIRFYSKSNYFFSFIMTIHLLALEDYKKQFEKLKKIFKKIKLLKGDEHEWYN
jgi:hypothetical protein